MFLAFKVMPSHLYHVESQSSVFIFTGIACFCLQGFMFILSFLTWLHRSSRFPFPLLMTQPFEFTTHVSVMSLGHPTLVIFIQFTQGSLLLAHSSPYFKVVRPLLILDMVFRVTSGDILGGSLGPQCGFRDILRHPFLLGLEPLCSSVSLSEFMSHWCLCGGLLGSSVEFTSLHSLFTLAFHFSVHIPYTRELYRRGAYLQTPLLAWFIYIYIYIYISSLQMRTEPL